MLSTPETFPALLTYGRGYPLPFFSRTGPRSLPLRPRPAQSLPSMPCAKAPYWPRCRSMHRSTAIRGDPHRSTATRCRPDPVHADPGRSGPIHRSGSGSAAGSRSHLSVRECTRRNYCKYGDTPVPGAPFPCVNAPGASICRYGDTPVPGASARG